MFFSEHPSRKEDDKGKLKELRRLDCCKSKVEPSFRTLQWKSKSRKHKKLKNKRKDKNNMIIFFEKFEWYLIGNKRYY